MAAGSGSSPVDVSATIDGLSASQEYFWELVTSNTYGPFTTARADFTTVPVTVTGKFTVKELVFEGKQLAIYRIDGTAVK